MQPGGLPVAEFAFRGPLRDHLVAAIASGAKTTTTGLIADYEHEDESLPRPGDRQVVVDSAGQPVTVIETVAVRVLRLADVDLAHDAIRAVESAAHATIEPNNAKATLGTMLGQFRNAPHVYRIAIPGPDGSGSITPLTAMMELLWTGQTSRHGGQTPTRPETFQEAQMAVHLAATLVQWFTSGAVTRR